MTWFSPVLSTRDVFHGDRQFDSRTAWPTNAGLGSAVAGVWAWDTEPPARPAARYQSTSSTPEGVRLRAPRELLVRMASAAEALGRSESDIWVEAAREWLQRHTPEDLSGARQRLGVWSERASVQRARRSRAWRDIDGVLDSLRDPHNPREARRERHSVSGAA